MKFLIVVFGLMAFPFAKDIHKATKSFDCPSKLSAGDSQDVGSWRIINVGAKANYKAEFENVALYDGHPQQMASVVPDIDNSPPKSSTWNLNSISNNYWLACRYKNTESKYAMNLPRGFTKCSNFYKHGGGGFICNFGVFHK